MGLQEKHQGGIVKDRPAYEAVKTPPRTLKDGTPRARGSGNATKTLRFRLHPMAHNKTEKKISKLARGFKWNWPVSYEASMTTPTPSGLTASRMASAIWRVRRSWTCSRRENMSAIRASLLNPITWYWHKKNKGVGQRHVNLCTRHKGHRTRLPFGIWSTSAAGGVAGTFNNCTFKCKMGLEG